MRRPFGWLVGATLVACAVGACAEEAPPSPRPSPSTTCEGPPTFTVIDAAGRESDLPITLTCAAALAALGPALAEAPAAVLSLEFGYGRYCPPGRRCGPMTMTAINEGYVVVTFDGAPTQIASVATDASGQTVVLNIGLAPPPPSVTP